MSVLWLINHVSWGARVLCIILLLFGVTNTKGNNSNSIVTLKRGEWKKYIGFVFGVTDLKGSNSNSIVTFTGGTLYFYVPSSLFK